MPANVKEVVEILFALTVMIIAIMVARRILKMDKIFENAADRDMTIISLLTFTTFWGLIYAFKAKISNEFISGLIVGQLSNVGMIVAFYYRHRNGG